MATLFQKYAALKTKVGGNRELFGYEETFGMPREEQQHITPPPRHIIRILAQCEFAIRLSESLEGKYDETVEAALDYLTAMMDEDGTITKSVSKKAEKMLMPLADEAKAYKLILAGHAHIDMNWMWSWQETVAATVATFTTMLNVMDEYPEFCFSQSQTSVYKIIDDYAPELHDRIKARIDEGRWEVTSSAWVETDKNMPGTESLLRHIKYAQEKLEELKQEDAAKKAICDSIIPAYKQFKTWAEEFDTAPLEMKKMIASQLFSRIEIGKGYEIHLELDATFKTFCDEWTSIQKLTAIA